MTFLFYFQPFLLDGYFITKNERSIRFMKKTWKRLCMGFLALATVVTLNRLIITDKEKCAEEIIKKCRENDFASTLFSYDVAKPNALYGTVYRSRFSMKGQKPLFHFRYTQTADTLGSYNIVDDPEAFTLVIE